MSLISQSDPDRCSFAHRALVLPKSEKSLHTPAGTFGRELLENFPPTQTGVPGAVETILFSADVNQ